VAEADRKASAEKGHRAGTTGAGLEGADRVRVVGGLGGLGAGSSLSIVAVVEEFGMAGANVN